MESTIGEIQFYKLGADHDLFELIADWYFTEWKIPVSVTVQRLEKVTGDDSQFQIVMTLNGLPVATAGVYHHVGLLDREPRFKVYKNWLALVYTVPDQRKKGYGALICRYVENYAKSMGIDNMHLFTDTAESLYTRLGWTEVERLALGDRKMVVMKKDLL